ncbi:hypothetical protein ACQP2P_38655 [Dactylosporangium sp. CA-139114]|uniref:hypothetical protein n=1 Tax=Dactylosporangium sp. CA-139114 TaxID=3239931 RepID=UPI003D99A40B
MLGTLGPPIPLVKLQLMFKETSEDPRFLCLAQVAHRVDAQVSPHRSLEYIRRMPRGATQLRSLLGRRIGPMSRNVANSISIQIRNGQDSIIGKHSHLTLDKMRVSIRYRLVVKIAFAGEFVDISVKNL